MYTHQFLRTFLLLIIFTVQGYLSFAEKRFEDTPDWYTEHLKNKNYSIDTSAAAIVLYEKLFVADDPGGGKLRTMTKVVHVLKKTGVTEADVTLYVYSPKGKNAYFKSIKGTVYNLENGKLVKQALDKKSIHYSPYLDDYIAGKFSLPSVKEGSILVYESQIHELDGLEIAQWNFQGDFPKLWSEIQVMLPTHLNVAGSMQSKVNFVKFSDIDDANKDKELPEAYISPGKHESENVTVQRWIRRNVSALQNEPYANDMDNYRERIELQTSGQGYSEVWDLGSGFKITHTYQDWRTWEGLNTAINMNLKEQVDLKNKRINKLAEAFWQQSSDSLEVAKKIYRYFRDSTEEVNKLARSVNKEKQDTGKNMLMYAVMRCAGLNATPVILSSKDGMMLSSKYPSLRGMVMNYIQVTVGENAYQMSPYNKYAPFGYLAPGYYNGFSWVIGDPGHGVDMSASLLKEREVVQITTLKNDMNDYQVSVVKRFGQVSAVKKRAAWNKDSSAIRTDITEEIKDLPLQGKLLDYRVENLGNPDTVLYIRYSVRLNWPKDKIAYITPSAYSYFDENPFKAAQRQVPVDLPYGVDVNVSVNLKLPEGYVVDEKPGSIIMKFDEKNYYKYVSEYNEADRLYSLSTRLLMQKTFFDVPEYAALKEFFDKTIEIQKKNLVLKK